MPVTTFWTFFVTLLLLFVPTSGHTTSFWALPALSGSNLFAPLFGDLFPATRVLAQHNEHSAAHMDCGSGSELSVGISDSLSLSSSCHWTFNWSHPLTLDFLLQDVAHQVRSHDHDYPIGEASNPGPDLTINVGNPSGLNNKEHVVYALPAGITCLSETQLAAPGQVWSCGRLRSAARSDGRRLVVLPGAAVPLRARSEFVGTWSGVLQTSDLPCHRVQLPWPNDEFRIGRAQVASFRLGDVSVLGTVVYGWAPGPTWPNARQMTRQLLRHLTAEIVHGAAGYRFISGDFNGDRTVYPELDDWVRAGWCEVQSLHASATGNGPYPTCKNSTFPDQLWVSPQLAACFRSCQVLDVFADHSVVSATFDLSWDQSCYAWWPAPSKIPWSSLDFGSWKNAQHTFVPHSLGTSTTDYVTHLGKHYEASFDAHFTPDPANGLPNACKGRGQHWTSQMRPLQPSLAKPSRQGEATLRSDLVGRSVQRWFNQLRRIQSLVHNLRRNSQSPSALEYRLQLWTAIKRSRGFSGSFVAWWSVRPHQSPGVPLLFPRLLPDLSTAELLFSEFQLNFRMLESWNLRHRKATLQAIQREDMAKAFASITGTTRQVPDRFVETVVTQVIAVDSETNSVQVEHPLLEGTQSVWLLDDAPVQVGSVDKDVCVITSQVGLEVGQTLEQQLQITDTTEMLSGLVSFWKPRWNRVVDLAAQQWTRLLDFVRDFMPRYSFTLPPITLSMWEHITKRYTKHSARGPDSFDHLDLLHMPTPYQEGLVSMLNNVELGDDWPAQLLVGYCHPLPKKSEASLIGDYRPIVIASMIYRNWSALRSRAILQQLRHVVSSGVVGFLPNREAGQIWHHVQMLIEIALQSREALHGVVSDVRKAFESVPRDPLFAVMKALGFPDTLLSSWRRFLDGFNRCFILHGEVSAAVPSNWGLPEGCGLSVVGMTIIDWCWDVYERQFSPSVAPMSYVDNYELLAKDLGVLMHGFASLETFMELWCLDLDSTKTYFWSTTTHGRTALRQLGKTVQLQAADLGGAMTYCRRTGAGSQAVRIQSLDPFWARLRKSAAPLPVKLYVLRQAFWAKAFHAIGITLLPFRWIVSLRTRAVRSLGFGLVGANPGIRLGLLCGDMSTDPGFYQAKRVFLDFRRFLSKDPSILSHWSSFMRQFDGLWLSGPFSKLLEICSQLGWSVLAPPWLQDHDGCCFNLHLISSTTFDRLLCDAWCQKLSRDVGTRKDFAGLRGLQWPASRHETRLSALDSARINSLREGVFLSGAQHGRYDRVKGSLCGFCQQEDTLEHRCMSCPVTAGARTAHPRAVQMWPTASVALRERLLPSRNPFAAARKCQLWELADRPVLFEEVPDSSSDWVDLFSDGSCRDPNNPEIALAAWSLVSATHERVLALGALGGIQQDGTRAETFAALQALRWTVELNKQSVLWTDSAYVARGLHCLLVDAGTFDPETNEDLWHEIADLLATLEEDSFRVQHVNSHLDSKTTSGPLDDWLIHWNGVADRNAGLAHTLRPAACQSACDAFRAHYFQSEEIIDAFRDFHLAVSQLWQASEPPIEEQDETEETQPTLRSWQVADDWLEALPLGWPCLWRGHDKTRAFPVETVDGLLQVLSVERDRSEGAVFLSWLELSAMLQVLGFQHPAEADVQGRTVWVMPGSSGSAQHGQITVAARIRFVRVLFRLIHSVFGCDITFVTNLDLSRFSVHPPQNGTSVYASTGTLRLVDATLTRFTESRPVRTANDFARPW